MTQIRPPAQSQFRLVTWGTSDKGGTHASSRSSVDRSVVAGAIFDHVEHSKPLHRAGTSNYRSVPPGTLNMEAKTRRPCAMWSLLAVYGHAIESKITDAHTTMTAANRLLIVVPGRCAAPQDNGDQEYSPSSKIRERKASTANHRHRHRCYGWLLLCPRSCCGIVTDKICPGPPLWRPNSADARRPGPPQQ